MSIAAKKAMRWPWLVMLVLVASALIVSGGRDRGPRTNEERVRAIAEDYRCLQCRSESVADSQALSARAIRDEIARGVRDGLSDGEIRARIEASYDRDEIALVPAKSGPSSLVWTLPVVALVVAAAGLAAAFRRWRPRPAEVTDEDRARVARALEADGP